MNLPIYLDDDVLKYLRARAEAKGMSLSDLVNAILKRDIDLIEAVTEPGGGEGCREAGRIDVSPGEGETA